MRSPLVSAAELARLLRRGSERPTVLDVRWELGPGPRRDQYEQGHIPGAAFVDLDEDLADPPGPRGRHPLPDAARFQRAMRRLGVDDERAVVVHDGSGATAAARAWWLLRYFGHPEVAVLDGGLTAWAEAGLELESGAATPAAPGSFTARAGGMPLLDADGALRLAERGVLLDARAPERFRGEVEPVDAVAGHIPGARSRPAALNLDEHGRFRSPEELRQAFRSLGIEPDANVGAYCGSGVSAAHEVLALELAGHRAALYPGSWSEWITDPSRPVASDA